MAAHGLGRLTTSVLWLMTTNASLWTMLAVSGPGLLRTLGWTLLVSLGFMFVVRAHSAGGTFTLSTPNGCRRGTAELHKPTASPGRSWQSMFLRSCSACSSSSPIVVGAMDVDAQCTLCTGPWSSTGPVPWYGVECPLLCNNRCRCHSARVCLTRQWIHVLRLCVGALWTNFAHFLREGGTQILKLILHPALLL